MKLFPCEPGVKQTTVRSLSSQSLLFIHPRLARTRAPAYAARSVECELALSAERNAHCAGRSPHTAIPTTRTLICIKYFGHFTFASGMNSGMILLGRRTRMIIIITGGGGGRSPGTIGFPCARIRGQRNRLRNSMLLNCFKCNIFDVIKS